MADEESVVARNGTEEAITQFLPICGEGNDQIRIRSAETATMRIKKLKERTEQWREQAKSLEKMQQLRHTDGECTALTNTRWSTEKISTTQKFKSWLPEGTWIGLRSMQDPIQEQSKRIFWRQSIIQLFQTRINVLYSVDYTGAIDNFNECEKWTQTEWLTCENKDVMEGIMHMKVKYKTAGMVFECFHNRGHPETYIPEKKPEN